MNSIFNFINQHQLQPGDAVELMCPQTRFPKHYSIYMGQKCNTPVFIANMAEGIRLIQNQELNGLFARYEVTNIERFKGSGKARTQTVRKALSRLGEKAYNFMFNNCEHFKNWVLYGESKSQQVTKIGTGVAVIGTTLALVGKSTNSKGLYRAGVIVLIILLIVFVLAWIAVEVGRTHGEKPNT